MSYTAPTMSSSSQTWANLKNRGFHQFVENVATANSATQKQLNVIHQMLNANTVAAVMEQVVNHVDNYTRGYSDKTTAEAKLLDHNFAVAVINQAIAEIGALVDAN